METDPEWKELQDKIDTTMEDSKRFMRMSMNRFLVCPDCSLPTYHTGEDSSAYCANCDMTYDREDIDGKNIRLRKREAGSSRKFTIIAVSIGAAFMLILAGLSIALYLSEREPDYISIYDIADIRGLDVGRNVPVASMSSDEFMEYSRVSLDDEMKEYLWELERFYECLLIIDDDWDLIALVENSTSAGILGFYDTDSQNLYIMDSFHTTAYVNYILSHEFTHALQDQNFDLDEYAYTDSYDLDLARMCVVEGDAMVTMNLWAEDNIGPTEQYLIEMDTVAQLIRSFDGYDYGEYSSILSEVSYFPYEGGEDFVSHVYDEGGWDAVNRLYTDKPPMSTEQILHYDKYESYELPEDISYETASTDLDLVFTSSVGEKLMTEMMYGLGYGYFDLTGDIGWSGDGFFYYEDGDDFLAVLVTSWDDSYSNDRFYDEFSDWIEYEAMDNIDGYYDVRGSYMDIQSSDNRTTMFYSNSIEVLSDVSDQ